MANLENNNDKEHHSLSEKVENAVQETKDFVKDAVEHPAETAEEFADQAAKDVVSVKWWAKVLLYTFWIFLFIFISGFIIINLDVTKKWAANQALQVVNQDFKAKMTTESVEVDYFGDVTIKGLKIEDYKGLEFIKAKTFKANSDWFSLASNAISGKSNSLSFNSLTMQNADIKVITYKGDSISNFIRFIDNFDDGKKRDPSKPVFQLNSRVSVLDSKISIINQNSEGEAGKWLTATNVNIKIPSLKVKGPEVFAQINNMSFTTERYGKKHTVDTFSGDFSLTKKALNIKDATIFTDHSLLDGNIKFNLNNGSWADFTNKVRWDFDLKRGSQISGYDISYFVTDWDNYTPINVSGEMNGALNNFYLSNFVIGNKEVSINTNTTKFQNLLKGNFTIESNSISTDFTYVGLKSMMPTFISEKMKNFADDFGRIKYSGAARVTPKEIYVPNANLITGIGQAKVSQFYLTDYSTDLPKYRGFADVSDLNSAVISKSPQVGLITGKFKIDGQSFDVNTMKLRTTSQIAKVEILNKEINNVFLDGTLDHRVYKGIIKVNDEQAKADVEGLIDFSTSKILADVNADVKYLNVNYFTEKPGNQIVTGNIVGKISMSDVNDLNLDADLKNFTFTNGLEKYSIPEAQLKTYFDNGNRVISVDAPGAVDGQISGKYNLADLAGMIENGLNKILVGPAPRKLYKGQQFDMNFDISQGLVSYFSPDIKIARGAKVEGSYDGNGNNLVLNVDADQLKYLMTKENEITDADKALAAANSDYKINPRDLISKDSAMVAGISIRINTANLDQQIFAKIDRGEYNKNIFKDVTLTGKNINNEVLKISANFLHGSPEDEMQDKLKAYAINLNQSTNAAGDFVAKFDPTDIKFNNITWTIDTNPELNHSITYRKKSKDFLIENLKIFSDESELFVKNAEFKSAKDFHANAEVKNLQMAKIFEMLKGGNSMDIQGLANGKIDITMNKNYLEPLIDLRVDNIVINKEKIGNLVVNAKNSTIPNVFDIAANLVSEGIIGNNNLALKGTIDNNTSSPTLDLKANMQDFDLAFTNQFVTGIFSNMRGKANGVLSISGTLKDIDYSGDIALNKFGLKLDFTGVDYSFDDTVIQLSKGLAILNNIEVKDGRNYSHGTISGAIQFETLASMGVNLFLRADNLLMLDTSQKDYDLFWGRIYGKGDLYVDGPVKALNLSTPNMKALTNSVFTFNSNSTSNVEEFKMLRFLKEDASGLISLEERKKSGANMNIDFNLDVDKGTTVNVIVGDDVGDISVRGTSDRLSFQMSREGNIAMNGTYTVDNGTYLSKALLNRTFQIVKGSNIRWDGDAMAPALDITANYMRTVSNAGDYLNVGSLQPINVLLQTKISQTLNNPKIELGVTAIDVSSQVKEILASKMSQEDEKVVQFSSVLLMGAFVNSSLDIDVGGLAQNSGINFAFKQLGSVLNTISNEFQIDLNYVSGDANSNTGNRANAGVSFALSPRVTVKTGLGIPLSKGVESANENYLSGEGTVELDVSKKNDGTLVLRGYSKPMNIGMGTASSNGTANQTYGAGIVWSKSFNTIFKRKNKKKDTKTDKSEKINKDSATIETIK